jgi:hypothetical protein
VMVLRRQVVGSRLALELVGTNAKYRRDRG